MHKLNSISPEFRHNIDLVLGIGRKFETQCPDVYTCLKYFGHDVGILDHTSADKSVLDTKKYDASKGAYIILSDDFSSNLCEIELAVAEGMVVLAPEARFVVDNENVHYYRNNNFNEFYEGFDSVFSGSKEFKILENFSVPSILDVYRSASALESCGFEKYASYWNTTLAYRAIINDGCRSSSFFINNLIDKGLYDKLFELVPMRNLEKRNGDLPYVWRY